MSRPRIRWHILVFLAPAVAAYTAVMIFPLANTLRLALYTRVDQERVFAGLDQTAGDLQRDRLRAVPELADHHDPSVGCERDDIHPVP